MLSIGEFSNICKVSTKTLRYYAEIGLLQPTEINPENGYRYYAIEQLETMLFINRLKSYKFSLEEIKTVIQSEEAQDEQLCLELIRKKKEMEEKIQEYRTMITQLNDDILNLKQGKSIMSYMDQIDVQLVEVPTMYLLSVRKMVQENEFPDEYGKCFGQLFGTIQGDRLTIIAPPMVLFHSAEYSPLGLDILSGILVKATKQSVFDFATENLFEPLGISVQENIVFHSKEEQMAFIKATDISGWVADPKGVNTGGWGLTLSAIDMAKIGQLYLDGGMWNGQQIVSKSWIEESTKEQSRWEKRKLSYGYLWWLGKEEDKGYAAMGDGGNLIYVNSEKKMVVSIVSLFKPNAKDRIGLIKKYVEPMFRE